MSRPSQATTSNGPVIPIRFQRALDQHLVFNFAGVVAWPLVLGVFGRPGDGKSFQIRRHLRLRNVGLVSINAADLESDRAGAPGKLVLDMYEDAGHRVDEGTPTAVVVDDFDTTVGEWQHSTTTVNHQQVLAQLMHLADNPTEAAGRSLRRVPVFITGNDLSKVYPPLRRPGRMRAFHWLPNESERREIVTQIVSGAVSANEVTELLTKLPGAPIAFFSDLVVEVMAKSSEAEVRRHAQDLGALLRRGSEPHEAFDHRAVRNTMTVAEIGVLALEMWHERALATQPHVDAEKAD